MYSALGIDIRSLTRGWAAALAVLLCVGVVGATTGRADDLSWGLANRDGPYRSGSPLLASTYAQAPGGGSDIEDAVNDPLEPLNRMFFGINEIFQLFLLEPLAGTYNGLVPGPVRRSVRNFLDNLSTPVILANDILQGEGTRAWQTVQRFAINTTVGVGGLIDSAKDMGIPKHKEDFGQTLAVWGVPEIFYMVLPLYGPSSPRDAVGRLVVDPYFDPLGLYLHNTHRDGVARTRMGVDGVTSYAQVNDELNQIRRTSIDYYASIRSLYRQKRKSEIANGRELELPEIPDFSGDPRLQPSPAERAEDAELLSEERISVY